MFRWDFKFRPTDSNEKTKFSLSLLLCFHFPGNDEHKKFYSVLASFLHTIFNGTLLFVISQQNRRSFAFVISGYLYRPQVPFYPNLKNSFTQNILTWLGWINSAINPFIYAFYSEDFRAAFYRLTFRRFCLTSKKKPPYPISSVSTRR